MDEKVKGALIARFEAFLAASAEEPEASEAVAGEAQDLYAIFVELAALRTEVRTESRLVKSALEQFREVFETLRSSQGALEEEIAVVRQEGRGRERTALKRLLMDVLELRDGLLAALRAPTATRLSWRERLSGKRGVEDEAWREGLRITLRRLDQALLDRRVTPLDMLDRPLDPRQARVLATADAAGRPDGTVLEELRKGYLWEDEVLRTAEVVVAKKP